MDSKFICPVCGGNIRYWQDYVYTQYRNINTKTGNPFKTVKHGKSNYIDDHRGFECCNTDCNWSINEFRDDVPDYLINWRNEHFEDIKI